MTIQGRTIGRGERVTGEETRHVDQMIDVPVTLKHARLREAYNELTLRFGDYAVTFRAYDEGVGYRFETSFGGTDLTVVEESAEVRFAGDPHVHSPAGPVLWLVNERHFLRYRLADLTADSRGSIRAVVDVA